MSSPYHQASTWPIRLGQLAMSATTIAASLRFSRCAGDYWMTALPRCSDVNLLGDGEQRRLGPLALLLCRFAARGCASGVPIFELADLNPSRWPANRRPQRERGGNHEVTVVILGAHVHPHVPCRSEVNLEAVQLRDQLLAHIGVLVIRGRPVSRCAASPPVFSSMTRPGSRGPRSVERSPLAVWIEYIPIIGYTASARRRRGRPSREHQEESKARWSAQVRSRALVAARSERVAGTRAAWRPHQPELTRIAERTRETAAAERTRASTHGRPLTSAERTRRPAADLMARGHERTRAVRPIQTNPSSP
jgi:hypothetical protein